MEQKRQETPVLTLGETPVLSACSLPFPPKTVRNSPKLPENQP